MNQWPALKGDRRNLIADDVAGTWDTVMNRRPDAVQDRPDLR